MNLLHGELPGKLPFRNGLPPSKDYVYRGTGKDILTPRMTRQQLAKALHEEAPEFKPYVYGATTGTPSPARPDRVLATEPPERCEVCGYLLTAPGHRLECGVTR